MPRRVPDWAKTRLMPRFVEDHAHIIDGITAIPDLEPGWPDIIVQVQTDGSAVLVTRSGFALTHRDHQDIIERLTKGLNRFTDETIRDHNLLVAWDQTVTEHGHSDWAYVHRIPDAEPRKATIRRRKVVSPSRSVRIVERDEHTCGHCGADHDLVIDHVVPWSKGGADDESNLQTPCRSCTSRKGAKDEVLM